MTNMSLIKVGLILAALGVGLAPVAVACDAKCEKVSKRALKQYGGKVEQAEKKSCVIKPNRSFRLTQRDCEKAIKYLDIKYDGYSDLIKSNPKIAEYRERHLKLNDKLANIEKLSTAEEVKAMTNSSTSPFGLKKFFD